MFVSEGYLGLYFESWMPSFQSWSYHKTNVQISNFISRPRGVTTAFELQYAIVLYPYNEKLFHTLKKLEYKRQNKECNKIAKLDA